MSAVAELEPQYVAPTPGGILFLARRSELILVWVPIDPIFGPQGRKIGETKGRKVRFLDGRCLSTDPEETAWLRQHPLFGDVHEGFWEVDPIAPTVSEAEIAALVQAMSTLDLEMLERIIKQEEQGWNRDALLGPARQGFSQLTTLLADAEATVDAAEAEAKGTDAADEPAAGA